MPSALVVAQQRVGPRPTITIHLHLLANQWSLAPPETSCGTMNVHPPSHLPKV
jgi:hypothetical protein